MEMFGVDFDAGQHRDMTRESLEIMLFIWQAQGPSEYKGQFWNVKIPDPGSTSGRACECFVSLSRSRIRPSAWPRASPRSETLKVAGEKGYIPMRPWTRPSIPGVTLGAVEEGRSALAGSPPRSEWRIVRDVWVADTGEEARRGAREGMLFRSWREYLHPLFSMGPIPLTAG